MNTAERMAAIGVLVNRGLLLDDAAATVDAIIVKLADIRLGVTGTVKRSPEGHLAELRADNTNQRGWKVLTGDRATLSEIESWETIYVPNPEPVRLRFWRRAVERQRNTDGAHLDRQLRLVAVERPGMVPREPRVIDGRGLGSTERDAEWTDRDDYHWKYIDGWVCGTPADGFRSASPDRLYAPYTEVVG